MVAYTTDFCLPFFEATDSPCLNLGTVCDPQNLWCAVAELVDAQLTAVDAIVARTVTAIPMARISFEGDPDDEVFGGTIPFDIVNLDTDNMVDLSVFPGIIPRRNGIYGIHATVGIAPVVTNDFPDVRIFIGNEAAPQQGGTLAAGPIQGTTRGFNTLQYIHLSAHWEFNDTTPSPRTISVVDNYVTSGILSAELAVFWHSDLDS